MRQPPTEVYFAVTEKNPDEKRYYSQWRLGRLYSSLAHAKLFFASHKKREKKLYKGTVVWEEVDVS